MERALSEPTSLANHHFMTNGLKCMQVVGLGRINKDKMGSASVNQLLSVFRQAKQRLQGPRKAAVKSRPKRRAEPLAQPVPFAPRGFEAPKPKWAPEPAVVLDEEPEPPAPEPVVKAPPVQAVPKVQPSAAPKAPTVRQIRTVPPPVRLQPLRRLPMYQRPRPLSGGKGPPAGLRKELGAWIPKGIQALAPKVVPPPPKQVAPAEETFQELVSSNERREISCEESLRSATAKASWSRLSSKTLQCAIYICDVIYIV